MSPLLAMLDLLASKERPSVPRRLLQDVVTRLRLHEARESYLLSYGDPFSQRVARGELDQHLLNGSAQDPIV